MKKEKENSKNNKKRNIILIVVGLILLAIILFLLWFFNRKFEVIFDYNNGTQEEVLYVKYHNNIADENVKTKEDLGEKFINWYLVVGEKDGEDILDDKPFDFSIKINENLKLKALYEGKVETITITFDSKGGSSVDPIIINKGGELTLPNDPTRKGYTFKGWIDKFDRPIYNNVKLEEDTTLYANWEENESKTTEKTTKKTTKATTVKTTTKTEAPKVEEKGEETISLNLTNKHISSVGTKKTSQAKATVNNPSGKVVYSISNTKCFQIDSNTGVIKVSSRNFKTCNENGATAEVTATLPSGKSASSDITLEKVLILRVGNKEYVYKTSDKSFETRTNSFTVIANQIVNWTASGVKDGSTVTVSRYSGNANPSVSRTSIKAYTSAGQEVEVYCAPYVA